MTMQRSALAVRLAVILLAALATWLVPHPGAGTVATARAGAVVLVLAEVVGWAVAYGEYGSPAPLRTAAFAAAVYLVHQATALAASVPIAADVTRAVVRGWVRRCLPAVAATALAGLLVTVIGHPGGSPALDIAGLAAAVVVVGLLVRASRNLGRRDAP